MSISRFRGPLQEDFGETNISELIERNLRALSWRLRKQHIRWHVDVDADCCFPLDSRKVSAVFELLIVDAIRTMPEGGVLDITVVSSTDSLEIEVADSGFDFSPLPGLRIFPSDRPLSPRPARTVWIDGIRVEVMACPQGGNARTICMPREAARAAA